MRPFTARMFPHLVEVSRATYLKGETGAASRIDGPTVTLRANVQLSGVDRINPLTSAEGEATGSVADYEVSFPLDPGVAAEDTITTAATNPFGPLKLRCVGPAAPVMRGAAFRVRCVVLT